MQKRVAKSMQYLSPHKRSNKTLTIENLGQVNFRIKVMSLSKCAQCFNSTLYKFCHTCSLYFFKTKEKFRTYTLLAGTSDFMNNRKVLGIYNNGTLTRKEMDNAIEIQVKKKLGFS